MSVYSKVGGLKPGRSAFNLSYETKFDCDMGELIPVYFQECVPGDTMMVGNEVVIRFQPLVAPVLQEINCYVHYFFVPARLLMNNKLTDWNDFISGGSDGETAVTLPKWTGSSGYNAKYTLWDYFGLPTGVNPHIPPVSFPKRAYNLIFNEYYRDENLQNEVGIDNDLILHRSWKKDYFTSALPWQQRGIAPALPLSGYSPIEGFSTTSEAGQNILSKMSGPTGTWYLSDGAAQHAALFAQKTSFGSNYNAAGVNFANAATFDVSDLRLAFQIQKFMERNARAGVRYTEFLRAHFGVAPRDEVLQRPQYIGGSKSPVMISEVLQTSQTTTGSTGSAQGNLAGHGLVADKSYICKYRCKEFGYIVGIMSVMPKSVYQQGVPRHFIRQTRYDFYFPEFAHLSEQGIFNEEVYADGSAQDDQIFGYQGRYNEMRSAQSIVCGGMRDTFDYWHLSRQFASRPNLNSTFIECRPRKDIFAVPSERGLIVNVGNVVKAIRPIPAFAEPGLIDHN